MDANAPNTFSVFRVIGSVGAIGLIVATIFLGGAPGIFFDVPSALLVGGLTCAMLIGLYGLEVSHFASDAFRAFFLQKVPPNPRYAAIARSGSRFALSAGAIGSLIGMIQMLTTLDDPSKIGGGMAIALLTALYGILLSEIVFGFLENAYTGPSGEGNHVTSHSPHRLGIPVAVIGLILTMFLVLLIAFSVIDAEKLRQGRESGVAQAMQSNPPTAPATPELP